MLRMKIFWYFTFLLAGMQTLTPASNPLSVLTVYDGSWTVAPGGGKADQLTNHCHMVDAFYTCEQVVNGKPAALLVFVAGGKAGEFHNQVVLPDGHAVGRGDLTIAGDHWTYLSKDDAGKPSFRVENFFTGRDRIHYEQYKAAADGTWTKVGDGDEQRVKSPAK